MSEIGRFKGVDVRTLQHATRQVQDKLRQAKRTVYSADVGDAPRQEQDGRYQGPGADAVSNRPGLAKYSAAEIEAAKTQVAELDAVFGPAMNMLGTLFAGVASLDRLDATQLDRAARRTSDMLVQVEQLQAALDAAGPAVKALFPSHQLEALAEAAKVDAAKIEAQQDMDPEDVAAARRERLEKLIAERSSRKRSADREGGPSGAGESKKSRWGGFFRREPEPIPDAVSLGFDAMPDAKTTGAKLSQLLDAPEIADLVSAALAGAKGPRQAQMLHDLKGYAVLADYAQGTLDYGRVGVGMFGHPKCRRSHQARQYERRVLEPSQPRQSESQSKLRRDLKAALTSQDPVASVRSAHVNNFLREIGVPSHVAAGFEPKAKAINAALKDELFAPLRALNESITSGRYRGETARAMLGKVREVTQAVVEGRFEQWRVEQPASQVQLAHLDADAQQTWLQTGKNQPDGMKLSTREAEGNELFWATKVGGPSHAFDTMNWCILSLLGNARTKAIVVDDPDWHQVAARAYLRLFKDVEGNPVVYLDPTQIDFPHREHHRDKRNDIDLAMAQHALAKAKALGASLAVAGGPWVLRDLGLEPEPMPGPLVLEPNGMVIEASDTLGRGHDWEQTGREHVRPRAAFLSAEAVAQAVNAD